MRGRGEEIRQFILKNVELHATDIASVTAEHFQVSRASITRHIKILLDKGELQAEGKTKSRVYRLPTSSRDQPVVLRISENQDEDKVWRELFAPQLEGINENVRRICHHGFTEIFNNVIDHSEGERAVVIISLNTVRLRMLIHDDGVGIFEKIKNACDLADHRQAILELAKGKLTTDPSRHTGQGIFFTSRMFDSFYIRSSHLFFAHNDDHGDDWLIEADRVETGTYVFMGIDLDSKRDIAKIFGEFSSGEAGNYEFSRTHVPLKLAKYGNEDLISRSQAKRVLARFDRFKEVLLDFNGVDFIGQAFADEIFRVFANNNPEIKLVHVNASEEIKKMIQWVQGGQAHQK